jgi:hypothetical protein
MPTEASAFPVSIRACSGSSFSFAEFGAHSQRAWYFGSQFGLSATGAIILTSASGSAFAAPIAFSAKRCVPGILVW